MDGNESRTSPGGPICPGHIGDDNMVTGRDFLPSVGVPGYRRVPTRIGTRGTLWCGSSRRKSRRMPWLVSFRIVIGFSRFQSPSPMSIANDPVHLELVEDVGP